MKDEKFYIVSGLIISLFLFLVIVVWGMLVKIDTYVIAPGKLVIKDYKKPVQYNRIADISKIFVKEGDFVEKNQPLLEIENTDKETDYRAVEKSYYALMAKRDRIISELHNYRKPVFSKAFLQLPNEYLKQYYQKLEIKIFYDDKNYLQSITNLYEKKEQTLKEKILALEKALERKKEYLDYIKHQIAIEKKLITQGLTDNNRLLDLQIREKQAIYDITSIKGQIYQVEKQLFTINAEYNSKIREFRDKLSKILENTNFELGKLKEKLVKYKFYVRKTLIRAPVSGQVIGLTVHSVGEVIKPGETIMFIVPKEETMFINARVRPKDIDKVHVGQLVDIRFPSFLSIAANSVEGKITYVSSDTLFDRRLRREYYEIHISLTSKGIEQIRKYNFQLIPGMPAIAYIKAEKVTPLEYMLQPLIILLKSAFRAA